MPPWGLKEADSVALSGSYLFYDPKKFGPCNWKLCSMEKQERNWHKEVWSERIFHLPSNRQRKKSFLLLVVSNKNPEGCLGAGPKGSC